MDLANSRILPASIRIVTGLPTLPMSLLSAIAPSEHFRPWVPVPLVAQAAGLCAAEPAAPLLCPPPPPGTARTHAFRETGRHPACTARLIRGSRRHRQR